MQKFPSPLASHELPVDVNNDQAVVARADRGALGLEVIESWPQPRPARWPRLGSRAFLGRWSCEARGKRVISEGPAETTLTLRSASLTGISYRSTDRVIVKGQNHA